MSSQHTNKNYTENSANWTKVQNKNNQKTKKLSDDTTSSESSRTNHFKRRDSNENDFPRKSNVFTAETSVVGNLLKHGVYDINSVTNHVYRAHLRGGKGTVHFGGIRFTRGTTLKEANDAIKSLDGLLTELITSSENIVKKNKQKRKNTVDRKHVVKHYTASRRTATLGDFIKF